MGSLKTFNMLNDLNIWGPIYKNFVKSLAKYIGDRKVLEVCCGNGWLSTGLMFYGVDIMPTDNFSWILSNRYKVNAYIKNMEAEEAILKYSDRDIILCSWAPYRDPVLERIYDLSIRYLYTMDKNRKIIAKNNYLNELCDIQVAVETEKRKLFTDEEIMKAHRYTNNKNIKRGYMNESPYAIYIRNLFKKKDF